MRKLLTTLLPTPNYLKHSNLSKNNLLPSYYYLLLPFAIRVFIYKVCTNCCIYV